MAEPTLFGTITADMARELAIAQKVCARPIMRRVLDRETGADERVAIPCGSTRVSVCPSCARKHGCYGCSNAPKAGTAPTNHPPPNRLLMIMTSTRATTPTVWVTMTD